MTLLSLDLSLSVKDTAHLEFGERNQKMAMLFDVEMEEKRGNNWKQWKMICVNQRRRSLGQRTTQLQMTKTKKNKKENDAIDQTFNKRRKRLLEERVALKKIQKPQMKI